MTPSGPHPYPDFSGDKHAPTPDGGPEAPDLAREVRTGVLVALAVAVGGVLLGALWLWLAPRVPLVSDGKAVYLKDSEGEAPIAGDGWFALLGVALGVVSGALVFWRCRRGGIAVVVGLAVGGVAASLLGMWLGMWLGPSDDVVGRAREIGSGKVFDAPLKLQAKAAVLAWPVGAMISHLLLTGAFGPRDPEPARDPWGGGWVPPNPRPTMYPAPPQAPQDGGGNDPWAAPPQR